MPDTLLRIQDLTVAATSSERLLLDRFTLSIKQKQSMALVGENGSGKTTLTKAILNLLPDTCRVVGGNIFLENQDIYCLSKKESQKVRGGKIATIFQNALNSLTPFMRIGTQIIDSLRQHQTMSKAEAKEKAIQLLRSVHFSDPEKLLSRYPFELSGGMRQRVVIAIALASSPKLILADEPTTALDSISQSQVLKILKQVHQTNDTALLLVTHNLALVAELCEHVAIIKNGVLVEAGSVEQVFSSPKHAYTKQLLDSVSKIPLDAFSSTIVNSLF